jgi:hypothetical protein
MLTFGLTIGVADDVEVGVAESEGPAIGVTNGPIGVADESVIGVPVGLAIGGVAEGLPLCLWMRIRVATSS